MEKKLESALLLHIACFYLDPCSIIVVTGDENHYNYYTSSNTTEALIMISLLAGEDVRSIVYDSLAIARAMIIDITHML